MGQLFHNISLTQPGITQPNGQFQNGQQAQNTVPSMPAGADLTTASAPGEVGKPSFIQAAKMGATPGGVNAMSPGLTKAGKLVTLLTSGLQGALAGRAADEQMIAQTGGRRSGGAGLGFQAGYMLPWQRAQQQAEAQMAQMGAQPIQTQFGTVPAAYLPKFIAPMLGLEGKRETNQTRENIAGQEIAGRAAQGAANRQNQMDIAQLAHRYHAVPNVGLFDLQTKAMVPGTEQGIPITPEIAKDYDLPAAEIGRTMPLNTLASFQNAQRFNEQVVEGAAGPALVNRNPRSPQFGQTVGLGLGNPSMGRPLQVGDVNNPGETMYMPAFQAISSGAPGTQSASVQVPRAAAKAEVPTQIGNQKVAFTTALQHADLLKQALTALNDPNNPQNVRTLNSLSNRFRTEFGSPDVTNFQAIANAYTREITKMLSAGHMTNEEISTNGATLPANASPKQILGVLDNYKKLAQSKMNMLNQQKQSAINQSQPNRGGGGIKIIRDANGRITGIE